MLWTRPRILLVASAAVSALAMLYVGFFQIGWLESLACPGFGSGCESVALASFSKPLGLAGGLLFAALGGLLCAVGQMKERLALALLVLLAFANMLLLFVHLLQMQKLGAFSLWDTLAAILSVPIAVLAVLLSRGDAPVALDDDGQKRQ